MLLKGQGHTFTMPSSISTMTRHGLRRAKTVAAQAKAYAMETKAKATAKAGTAKAPIVIEEVPHGS